MYQTRVSQQKKQKFKNNFKESVINQKQSNILQVKRINSQNQLTKQKKPIKNLSLKKMKKRTLCVKYFKNAHILPSKSQKKLKYKSQSTQSLQKQLFAKLTKVNYKEVGKNCVKKIHSLEQRQLQQKSQFKQQTNRSRSQMCHAYQYKISGFENIDFRTQQGTLTRIILQKPNESSINLKSSLNQSISDSQNQQCLSLLKQLKQASNNNK